MAMPATIIAQDNAQATGVCLREAAAPTARWSGSSSGAEAESGIELFRSWASKALAVTCPALGWATRGSPGSGKPLRWATSSGWLHSIGSILARVRPEGCYGEYRVRNLAYQRLG